MRWSRVLRISSATAWLRVGLGLLLWVGVTSCEGSPFGASIERSLEADPQLADNPDILGGNRTPASTPGLTAQSTESSETDPIPEPGQSDFIGPIFPAVVPDNQPTIVVEIDPKGSPQTTAYKDLGEAPEELQPYLQDMVALGVLKVVNLPASSAASTASTTTTPPVATDRFKPNQPISRREFARWLLATNNRFYADQVAKKLRPAVGSSARVFQDIAPTDPDFSAIQGLAESGIIPSPLTGSSTAVTFRPDAPLTRKDLVLWKIPLDTREALPNATIEAVQQTWGFQDTAKIEPPALPAVLADHQLGEFANIRRAFGYTTLFQPNKGVTRAEAAAALWRFGTITEGLTAAQILQPAPATTPSPPATSE